MNTKFIQKLLATYKVIAYIFLILFLIGIFLYTSRLITETALIIVAIVSAILYFGLFIFKIEKDKAIEKVLHNWSKHSIIQKPLAFSKSYLKNLLRYGIVFLVVISLYFSVTYFQDHDLKDIFPETIVSPFDDLEATSWVFPAMNFMYEMGLYIPDADNFIHPSRILDVPETLSIFFAFFDVQSEDYAKKPEVNFAYISKSSEYYPLFKAAYHMDLINKYMIPDQTATKSFALTVLADLDNWPKEEDINAYAYNLGFIENIDPIDLSQPLNRAILAQLLFKLYEIKTAEPGL
ncbi:hypothetical protein KKF04_03200 [Patescibacteria group bacterium]|nr:hypothetical protein [Patescibacteria group bacterium]